MAIWDRRLIRDRFIAGHSSCELRRYLDSVPPESPIRDVVDRCRVWESHANPEIRRISKPGPEPVYPAYVVGESDDGVDDVWVATVNQPKSPPDQVETSMAPPIPVPAPVPEDPVVERLLQRLVAESQRRPPAPVIRDEPGGLEKLLRSFLSGQQISGQQSRQRPARRCWNDVVCFSCGKTGHGANRCPTLDETFPFMLSGWKAESTPGGYLMISPRMAADRRRAENRV